MTPSHTTTLPPRTIDFSVNPQAPCGIPSLGKTRDIQLARYRTERGICCRQTIQTRIDGENNDAYERGVSNNAPKTAPEADTDASDTSRCSAECPVTRDRKSGWWCRAHNPAGSGGFDHHNRAQLVANILAVHVAVKTHALLLRPIFAALNMVFLLQITRKPFLGSRDRGVGGTTCHMSASRIRLWILDEYPNKSTGGLLV
ncbi:hypothetical protein C8R45DRAFT_1224748 [Mycena sanguinolenta]|nr:hypothetical protein C8R45DRAFT_1224748 [Mycena sanguinolenta]